MSNYDDNTTSSGYGNQSDSYAQNSLSGQRQGGLGETSDRMEGGRSELGGDSYGSSTGSGMMGSGRDNLDSTTSGGLGSSDRTSGFGGNDNYGSSTTDRAERTVGATGAMGGSSMGNDDYSSSTNTGMGGSSGLRDNDNYGSSTTGSGMGRDTMGSSGLGSSDNYGSSGRDTMGSSGLGSSDNTYSSSGNDRFGDSSDNALGSGYTAGVGHGNKTAEDPEVDNSDTRFGSHDHTGPYKGGSEKYSSGTVGGVGAGNKHESRNTDSEGKKDSTMGKLMEKAGGLMKNEGMKEKGYEKREQAGAFEGQGDSYGSSGTGSNY